ncbi:MAG TPA: hypothetical protein VI278_15485 [Nitrososphaeraceae archaeon]
MRYIDRSNDDNNNNKQVEGNSWIWLIAYMAIGLAISFVVPFPISFVMALLVFFLLNAVRMHIALKRQRVIGGIKELYKSVSTSFDGDNRNNNGGAFGSDSLAYPPIKFYCMNCGYEHRKYACPKCDSKAVRLG